MRDSPELPALRQLLAGQPLAVLSTQGGGQPYGSLVAFAVTDDLERILFATDRATRKFANLTAESRVSLVVDNRSNRRADFRDAAAVTIVGRAAEAAPGDRVALLALLLAKHPDLESFATAPGCALVVVRVERYYLVRRFQAVAELPVEP